MSLRTLILLTQLMDVVETRGKKRSKARPKFFTMVTISFPGRSYFRPYEVRKGQINPKHIFLQITENCWIAWYVWSSYERLFLTHNEWDLMSSIVMAIWGHLRSLVIFTVINYRREIRTWRRSHCVSLIKVLRSICIVTNLCQLKSPIPCDLTWVQIFITNTRG